MKRTLIILNSSRPSAATPLRAGTTDAHDGYSYIDASDRFGLDIIQPSPRSASFYMYVPHDEPVDLVVVDAMGRIMRTLLHGPASSGTTAVTFDGRDDSGSKLASGTYFARLGGGSLTESRKFLWLQ